VVQHHHLGSDPEALNHCLLRMQILKREYDIMLFGEAVSAVAGGQQ
jgi:hypothetical protein